MAMGMLANRCGDGRIVEADETFMGGKARNTHKHVREEKIKGCGPSGKTIVIGLLPRGGSVKTMVGGKESPVVSVELLEVIESMVPGVGLEPTLPLPGKGF